jgi:hypothetical protein
MIGVIGGRFKYFENDSLVLKVKWEMPDVNLGNKYDEYPKNAGLMAKIHYNDVEELIYYRKYVNYISAGFMGATYVSGLIVSPLVSIEKGRRFNTQRFLTISGISAGVYVVFTGINYFLGKRKFITNYWMRSKNKRWDIRV